MAKIPNCTKQVSAVQGSSGDLNSGTVCSFMEAQIAAAPFGLVCFVCESTIKDFAWALKNGLCKSKLISFSSSLLEFNEIAKIRSYNMHTYRESINSGPRVSNIDLLHNIEGCVIVASGEQELGALWCKEQQYGGEGEG